MAPPDAKTTTRVFRYALDPTAEQRALLQRYADAYRATYNYGWGIKNYYQQVWANGRERLIRAGMSKADANRNAPEVKIPSAYTLTAIFRSHRDKPFHGPWREGEEPRSMYPWWAHVNENMCCQAFTDLDRAWRNWKSGTSDYPRLKKRGHTRDSFRTQSIKKIPDHRHVTVPGGGTQKRFTVRLQMSTAPMLRAVNRCAGVRGCGIKGVTFSREGLRWFAAFNVTVLASPEVKPDKNQRAAGAVGVDLGVAVMAATSKPVTVGGVPARMHENPRHIENVERNLRRWQRRAARRYVRGIPAREQSQGWREAQRHVTRLHALVAARRRGSQHLLTKALVTHFEHVVIEDLRVKNMTKSAKGTIDEPGKNVRQKAGLNREIMRVGWGEIRRQLEYKAAWHGATVTAVNPAYTSRTCSACGCTDGGSRRTQAEFRCTTCGHTDNADLNAATQIENRLNRPGT